MPFRLRPRDRTELEGMVRRGVQQVRVVLRVLALLQLDRGDSAPRVSQAVGLTPEAIRRIAHRYRRGGVVCAVFDGRRAGAAQVLAVADKQRIIAMVCSTPPAGAARWTVRLIAEEAVKRQVVPRIGRETMSYPKARTIHLVLDNLNTHRESSLIKQFGRRHGQRLWRRLTVHGTPKHASWLNQAEIALSLIARQCLGTQRIPELALLRTHVRAWNRRANRRKVRITWRFTRKDARRNFAYTPPSISKRSRY